MKIKPKWTAGKNLFLGCQVVKSIRGGSFLPVGTCSSSTSCYFCDSSYSQRRLPKASELASGRAQLRPVVSPSRGALASPHVTGDSGRVSGIAICANSSCATFWEKPEPIKANMGSKRGQQTWTANVDSKCGQAGSLGLGRAPESSQTVKGLPGHLCGKSCLPPWHQLSGWGINQLRKERCAAFHGGRKRMCLHLQRLERLGAGGAFKGRWMLYNRR